MAGRTRILAAALAAGLAVSTFTACGPPPRVDNPFDGAVGYVNPQWATRVRSSTAARENPAKAAAVAGQPTAVWLDRIAAVTGTSDTWGLERHLDEALTQQQAAGGAAMYVPIVIYDLPNRDCAALASNGELTIAADGLTRYKQAYIDVIAGILSNAKYANLRIVAYVEPDSLPNLVTNVDGSDNPKPACNEALGKNQDLSDSAYVQGVRYALEKLRPIGNVYTYLDLAHSGWLGWDNNIGKMVNFLGRVLDTAERKAAVDGFVSNTANYTPTAEPNLTPGTQVGGQPIQSAKFYEWNPIFDEKTFGQTMYSKLVGAGFPASIGMLIDTSRNGWGPALPAPATASNVDDFVRLNKVDRRIHRGNWCNQKGAGIGERPKANPMPHFDAYVWVKPPGESDGSDHLAGGTKGIDPMCKPGNPNNPLNGNNDTGVIAPSPIAGQWFDVQFTELVRNAYPAL